MKISLKSLGLSSEVLILIAVGLVVVMVIAAMSPTISIMSGMSETMAAIDVNEMHKEFECSCCGKNIGECSCGMAKERRTYVEGLAAGGLNKRGIYKAMVKKYTVDILFNEALAAEIKDELIAEAPADRPILELTPASIDAGVVSMAKGKVEQTYKIKNTGETDLIITGMESSCMCTSAILRSNNQESPVFGMHDNPTDWSTTIAPGGEAELIVTFDPNAHGPDAVGPVTRMVTVHSNDIIDATKKVKFEAEVVK